MRRRMGRPGLVGTMARTAVISGTATAVSGGVQRRSAQNAAARQDRVEQPAPQAPQYAQAPPPPPAEDRSIDDKIAKIKELGALKDSGLLTEEEFAVEKAKVLAG